MIGGISLRDTQWEEIHASPLGPTVKCKSFATAMSSEVVTADELIDVIPSLSGEVLVDGEVWATGRADDFAHPLEACVARSAAGEPVFAGGLLSTGTFAGCSGIEIGRLPRPGAQVTLRIGGLGTLTNYLGACLGVWRLDATFGAAPGPVVAPRGCLNRLMIERVGLR